MNYMNVSKYKDVYTFFFVVTLLRFFFAYHNLSEDPRNWYKVR